MRKKERLDLSSQGHFSQRLALQHVALVGLVCLKTQPWLCLALHSSLNCWSVSPWVVAHPENRSTPPTKTSAHANTFLDDIILYQ